MKKSILILIFFISLSTVFSQSESPQRIGYVDSQIILNQYPAAIKAQSDLDALISKWNKSVDSMTTELQNVYTDYQKQAQTMTEEKQRSAQQDLVLKEQKINEFRQQKFGQPNGELYNKQEEFLTPVKGKIIEAINTVAAEENLQFVFDKSGDIILLYADAQFDITFKVLDKLKRGK